MRGGRATTTQTECRPVASKRESERDVGITSNMLQTQRVAWNASTVDRDHKFPDPHFRRVNSVGMSIRPEIDPRAETLPKRMPVGGVGGKEIGAITQDMYSGGGGGGDGGGNGTGHRHNTRSQTSLAGGGGRGSTVFPSSVSASSREFGAGMTIGGGGIGPAQASTRFRVPVHPELDGKHWEVSTQLDKRALYHAAQAE
jgi:hypothetical protein